MDYTEKSVARKVRINYSTFGMQQEKRCYSYQTGPTTTNTGDKPNTHGFGGQENDFEIYNIAGATTTAEYWEYDTRLGRRWNVDPVVKPWESPYATFSNNPIVFNDPNGDDPKQFLQRLKNFGTRTANAFKRYKKAYIPVGKPNGKGVDNFLRSSGKFFMKVGQGITRSANWTADKAEKAAHWAVNSATNGWQAAKRVAYAVNDFMMADRGIYHWRIFTPGDEIDSPPVKTSIGSTMPMSKGDTKNVSTVSTEPDKVEIDPTGINIGTMGGSEGVDDVIDQVSDVIADKAGINVYKTQTTQQTQTAKKVYNNQQKATQQIMKTIQIQYKVPCPDCSMKFNYANHAMFPATEKNLKILQRMKTDATDVPTLNELDK